MTEEPLLNIFLCNLVLPLYIYMAYGERWGWQCPVRFSDAQLGEKDS